MAPELWAVYVDDPACEVARRFAGPFGSVWEARMVAAELNRGRPNGSLLYFAGHLSGDGPTPAGRTDYPEDGGDSPVPWGWREERQPEQTE